MHILCLFSAQKKEKRKKLTRKIFFVILLSRLEIGDFLFLSKNFKYANYLTSKNICGILL